MLLVAVLAGVLSTVNTATNNVQRSNSSAPVFTARDRITDDLDGDYDPPFVGQSEFDFVSGLEQLPASLRGTEPDGGFSWDEHNELVITESIRDLFDYFLASSGEEPLASLVARIQAYIETTLPEPAASQARSLLQDYLAMKAALVGMEQPATPNSSNGLDSVRNHLQALQAVRNSYLSPEVAAVFYAEADEYDRYTLQRLEIMQNPELSGEEKESQLTGLDDSLSLGLQQSLGSTQQLIKLSHLNNQIRDSGASDDAVLALRSELVGYEAAERLQTLDQERRQWSERMDLWLQERALLLDSEGLDSQDRQRQVSQRRHQFFDAQDVRRVLALESLYDQNRL